MSTERMQKKRELTEQAQNIWTNTTKRGRVRPTSKERDVLVSAYHMGVLPKDKDYSVYQWVEDNFPTIT